MTSFLYRAGAGVAGDITRPDDTIVEPGLLDGTNPPILFGVPVKMVAGKVVKIAASDAATAFYGILSRVAPSIAGSVDQSFGASVPNLSAVQGIVVKGYVNVLCPVGTPVRGGVVYMRVTAATGKLVGDFEASSDSALSVVLPGVTWGVSGKDAANVTEIRIA